MVFHVENNEKIIIDGGKAKVRSVLETFQPRPELFAGTFNPEISLIIRSYSRAALAEEPSRAGLATASSVLFVSRRR